MIPALFTPSPPIPVPAVPPDYAALAELLAASPLKPSPAESHGIYAGLMALGAPQARSRWLAELVPDQNAALGDALRALAEATDAGLADPSMGFALLLPDEEQGLRERADALLDWIRGLLYGLGLAGLNAERLSPPAREALADLLEVTRMDLDDLADDDADELALAEIVEFVRVAVMLLQSEPRPDP